VWSLRSPTWHVGMSTQRVTLSQRDGGLSSKKTVCDSIDCMADAAGSHSEVWRPAVTALSQWLTGKGIKNPKLNVMLSGRFVRWQLLPWQAGVSQPKELAAYASLRFHDTFGKAADDWQVMYSPQPPGLTVAACAVDAALIEALRSSCEVVGANLTTVSPYFAFEFDRRRDRFNKKAAWFGLIESDCLSLGLLQGGQWMGLRSQRMDADWRDALPGMMAQMGIAAGVSDESVPLYLTGGCDAPKPVAGLAFTWLASKAQGI